jgi:hypothetical protein
MSVLVGYILILDLEPALGLAYRMTWMHPKHEDLS